MFRAATSSEVRVVADRLDVMPVGIDHESSVVVGVVVLAHARAAVVGAARAHRRRVKRANRLAPGGAKRDVDAVLRLLVSLEPEVGFAARAEARPLLPGHDELVAE